VIFLAVLFVGSFMFAHGEMSECGHQRSDLFARERCRAIDLPSPSHAVPVAPPSWVDGPRWLRERDADGRVLEFQR
jgi:hypothetical protein